MSTDLTAKPATTALLSTKNKIGLVLGLLLGLADITGPFMTPSPDPGQEGPPMAVLVAGSILGLISVIAAIYALRTGNRIGSRIVAGSRILSSISALPAFFVGDVPAGLIVLAASGIVVTLIVVALVLSRPPTAAR